MNTPSHDVDHFKVLEVQQHCSDDEVKQAYLRLAKKWHPDINKSPEAVEKFKVVSEAYDLLKDGVRRSHYRVRLQDQARSYQPSPFTSYHGTHYHTESSSGSTGSWFRSNFGSFGAGARRAGSGLFLFGGPLLGMALLLTLITGQNDKKQPLLKPSNTVEAWYNSKYGNYCKFMILYPS